MSNTKTPTNQANVYTYNDYYPYGSIARSGGISYRYEYQGAYAEKDPVTGFNNFDLRMYDGRIGRWLSTDPNAQYYSPYVGMGNDPVSRVDPDGGFAKGDPPTTDASKVDVGTTIKHDGTDWTSVGGKWSPTMAEVTFTATRTNKGVDWRGVGEASLGIAGGAAEILAACGTEWFSAGIATPVAVGLATDGSFRVGFASVKLMAALGGMTEARNAPSNLGGMIGMGVDKVTGSMNGQKIGALINDVGTVILTGGTAGTISTLLNPSAKLGIKVLTISAQSGAYSDVLSNGGVYDRK